MEECALDSCNDCLWDLRAAKGFQVSGGLPKLTANGWHLSSSKHSGLNIFGLWGTDLREASRYQEAVPKAILTLLPVPFFTIYLHVCFMLDV